MVAASGRLLAGFAVGALLAIGCGGENGGAGGSSGSGGAGRGGTTGHAGTGGATGGAGATSGTAGTTGTAGAFGGSGGGGAAGTSGAAGTGGSAGGGATGSAGTGGAAGTGGTTGSAGTGGAAGTGGSGEAGTTGSAGTGGAAATGGSGGAGTTGSAGTGGVAGTGGPGGAGTGGGGATGSAGTGGSGPIAITCTSSAAWLGDFDGDGVPDCARAQAGAGTQLDLVFNKGVSSGLYLASAVITPDMVAPAYLTTGTAPRLVFDLNHDSRQDIIIGVQFPRASPTTVIQSYLQFFRGHADGTFDRHAPAFDFIIGEIISWQPAFADFDGDGFADTVATSAQWSLYSDFYFYVLKSSGGSDLRIATGGGVHTLRGTAGVMRAADLNGDSKVDLVVHAVQNPAAQNLGLQHYVAVALATSDAAFSEAVKVSGTDGATAAQVSDVNTDGKPDLLVVLPTGTTPFYGNGAGQFSTTAP